MGSFYKGHSKSYHSLLDNIDEVKKHYNLSKNGFFGEKGKSKERFIRQIICDNPIIEATKFYNLLAYGGQENIIYKNTNKIIISYMKDGTIITLRTITSSQNSPAVEINIRKSNNHKNIKYQKIHFESENNNDTNK